MVAIRSCGKGKAPLGSRKAGAWPLGCRVKIIKAVLGVGDKIAKLIEEGALPHQQFILLSHV